MKLRIAILVFVLSIISMGGVYGADWKFYGSCEIYWGYYDAQGIAHPSKNIVRVWQRWNFKEKGIMEWVGKLGKDFENLNYGISLLEINCVEKTCRVLSANYYDNKGKVILSNSSPDEWDFIVPESIGEGLYKEICK